MRYYERAQKDFGKKRKSMEWKEKTLDNGLKVLEVIIGTIESKHTEVTEKDIEDSCEKLRSLGLFNVKARTLEIKKV